MSFLANSYSLGREQGLAFYLAYLVFVIRQLEEQNCRSLTYSSNAFSMTMEEPPTKSFQLGMVISSK